MFETRWSGCYNTNLSFNLLIYRIHLPSFSLQSLDSPFDNVIRLNSFSGGHYIWLLSRRATWNASHFLYDVELSCVRLATAISLNFFLSYLQSASIVYFIYFLPSGSLSKLVCILRQANYYNYLQRYLSNYWLMYMAMSSKKILLL